MIFLITLTPVISADKAGDAPAGKPPIQVAINGLRDDDMAKSCLVAINRYRKRPVVLPERGDGEYQIVIEKKRPGFVVRVERMGTALKTARALHDYEVCIAAAAIAREAIADE